MNMIVLEIPLKNPTTRYSAFMLHVALSSTRSWQNPLERIALFLKSSGTDIKSTDYNQPPLSNLCNVTVSNGTAATVCISRFLLVSRRFVMY